MARFDWFAWHRNYRIDEWIHSLTEAERWAWVCFLSYSNETDFEVDICNVTLLAPLLAVTPITLQSMLLNAIKNGKILESNGKWVVKNGHKYRVGVDKTNASRQAKYRETQKLNKNESNGSNALRNVTPVTVTLPVKTETITNTKTRQRQTEDSIARKRAEHVQPDGRKEFADKQVQIWNSQKTDGWPVVNFDTLKPPKRKLLIDALWAVATEEDFDLETIMDSAKEQPYLHGKLWFTLYWLTQSKDLDPNYRKVLNKNYGNSTASHNGHQPAHLGAAGKTEDRF